MNSNRSNQPSKFSSKWKIRFNGRKEYFWLKKQCKTSHGTYHPIYDMTKMFKEKIFGSQKLPTKQENEVKWSLLLNVSKHGIDECDSSLAWQCYQAGRGTHILSRRHLWRNWFGAPMSPGSKRSGYACNDFSRLYWGYACFGATVMSLVYTGL